MTEIDIPRQVRVLPRDCSSGFLPLSVVIALYPKEHERNCFRAMQNLWLALRSLFWTVAFPGFTAGYVPWVYFDVNEVAFDFSNPLHLLGALLILVGATILLTCIFEFARTGRGTLSPADPTKVLVVRGLYRYVRNPMYVGVLTIIAGHLVLKPSVPLLVYWFFFLAVASAFIIGFEEPYLRSRFGESYVAYTRRVRRWIPRFPADG